MKWLDYLENNNIPFNIYILDIGDCFIFHKKFPQKQLLIILNGLIKLINVFTNNETICTKLLYKYHLIASDTLTTDSYQKYNNYYKAQAIIKTAILAIPLDTFKLNKKQDLFIDFLHLFYFIDLFQPNKSIMVQILCHRNTKKRIIHLLLILAKKFGYLNKTEITIPFYISHQTIGIITGSQRVNVTRIMNYFKKQNIISYKKQSITIHNLLRLIQL